MSCKMQVNHPLIIEIFWIGFSRIGVEREGSRTNHINWNVSWHFLGENQTTPKVHVFPPTSDWGAFGNVCTMNTN